MNNPGPAIYIVDDDVSVCRDLVTMKVHRSRVMQKMQAKTVTELIHSAQKVGITSLQG